MHKIKTQQFAKFFLKDLKNDKQKYNKEKSDFNEFDFNRLVN